MAKRASAKSTEPATDQEQPSEPSEAAEATVQFETNVSWAGDEFSYVPGQIVPLPESIARARAEAGMGTIVEASSTI